MLTKFSKELEVFGVKAVNVENCVSNLEESGFGCHVVYGRYSACNRESRERQREEEKMKRYSRVYM